jgi:hypothetical protein
MTRALRVERALGSVLMLTIGLFTAAAVLTGTASPLYGQSGDSLQQKLASQFVLTKMAADRSDIVTPGTVVALLKFGLTLRSVAAPAPPLSTYKNGKISGPSFGADLKNTIFKVPGNGTTADYPIRQFRTVERLWVTGLSVSGDGVVLTLYSDPYDGTHYYGQLKFPFEKRSVPDSDEMLRTIAEVLQKIDTSEVERVAGTYIGVGAPANQVQLNSDGTYSSVESGRDRSGPFLIHGSTLMLRTGNAVATCTLQGETITDQAGSKWVKQATAASGRTPTPVGPLRLPATYVSAQTASDQLQLNADNSFSLQASGQTSRGTFAVNGNTLEITITDTGTKTPMTMQGNNLTDPSGQVWVQREQSGPVASNAGGALRNEDVVKMVKAGLDDSIVISKIKASGGRFDTDPDTLIALKTSGVSSAVLKAMTDASAQPQTEPGNRPAPSGAGLPASYGGFLFDGTQYQPLAPAKISVVVGLTLRAGGNGFAVDGFSGEPPQSPVAAPSQILVYQQNVDIASVHLARLTLVRSLQAYQFNIATATVNPNPSLYPSLFGVQYNQVIPINLWRPLGQGIPVRTEPVMERNGMFRLIPDAPLPPGKYALYFGDSVHASDIVFTANGAAGTAYFFEVRAGTK